LIGVSGPTTIAEEFLKETVPHARHICITKVGSGISNSSQAVACGRRLYAGDPRVAKRETMRATRRRPDAKTVGFL
jgi:hypothetical protein